MSASTRRWSFFSLSFLRALYSSFFYAEYERKRSLPPGCRRSTDLTVYLIKENLLNYHDLIT